MDWVAFGLPVEKGQNGPVMVIEQIERQVPTCHLNESVGDAKRRAEKLDFQICVVVNEQGIVLGLVEKHAWRTDPAVVVETIMEPGPTTLRPSYSLEDAKELVVKSRRDAIVTSSDGRLVGMFKHQDGEHKKQIPKSRAGRD
jgi:CBS domain-containing protein